MTDPTCPPEPHVADKEIDALWRSLRSQVGTHLRHADQAEDIVQEAFLRLLEQPPKSKDHLPGWLRVVARRLIIERSRRARSRERRERATAREESVPPGEPHPEREPSQVVRLLAELRDPYRQVVQLRFLDGLEIAEIADRLGRSQGTVRSQIKRGLDLLRERLGVRADDRERPRGLAALLPYLGFRRRRSPESVAWSWRRVLVPASAVGLLGLCLVVLWSRSAELAAAASEVRVASGGQAPTAAGAPDQGGAVEPSSGPSPVSLVAAGGTSASSVASNPLPPIEVRGLVRSRPDDAPIAGARIVASRDPEAIPEEIAVTGEDGRFSALVSEFPIYIGAEPSAHSSTRIKRVDRAFALSGEELYFESLRSGSFVGTVVDELGTPVVGAEVRFGPILSSIPLLRGPQGLLERAAGTSRTRTDSDGRFSLPLRDSARGIVEVVDERIGTGSFVVEDVRVAQRLVLDERSLAAAGRRAETERERRALAEAKERAADASRTCVLRGRLRLDGDLAPQLAFDLVVRGDQLDEPVLATADEDLRFEIPRLPAGRIELLIEGGGAHGAWRASEIVLAPGGALDLGVLVVPTPGHLRIQTTRRAADVGPRADLLILTGPRGGLFVNLLSPTLGLRFDEEQSWIELRRIWPGSYVIGLTGEHILDVEAEATVRANQSSRVDLELIAGSNVAVRARFEGRLASGEEVEIHLRSPRGVEVRGFSGVAETMEVGNKRTFSLGIADDVERIEFRTVSGHFGSIDLPPAERRARQYNVLVARKEKGR